VEHDGNGWVQCARGHRHWGVHGAAGLLLHAVDDDGVVRVLLQHRAAWSHHGDTWGLPGGARDSHEDVVAAALREAGEEAALDRGALRVRHTFVDDHGGWAYTTVHADTPAPLATVGNRESEALVWVALPAVPGLPLHPGFAATWPEVRANPVVVLVDVANVMGSRPDGWWRDRAGAAARLLRSLDALRAVTVAPPGGRPGVVGAVVAVLEGASVPAADPDWAQVRRAPRGGHGDDAIVAAAGELVAAGHGVLAVTADRGLRERLQALAGPPGASPPQVVGPRWLLDLLEH
jgi:8-oxo-dGTP pyrophosphatase MutT (NUDIX family)